MKKIIRKLKRLFIEELEVRRSTSPLLIQTLAVGEAGGSAKDDQSGAASSGITTTAVGEEGSGTNITKPIYESGNPPMLIAAPTTLAIGEESKPKKPPIYIVAPPVNIASPTTLAIGEEGKPPMPVVAPPVNIVSPTTLAVGEEGNPPMPVVAPPQQKPPPGVWSGTHKNRPK